MHGLTVRLSRTVLPSRLNNLPSSSGYARLLVERCSTLLTPTVCGWEGRFDMAIRAETHALGHNWAATADAPPERELECRGNAQPQYPLRGILAHLGGEDVKTGDF